MACAALFNHKYECCGCGACAAVCSNGAIDMRKDEEGFLYPVVADDKCVECGACVSVCRAGVGKIKASDNVSAFAAYCIDESIRKSSSSGGIFSILAEEVLRHGGVVYGAAFDERFSVKHIAVDNVSELPRLRGSKYVQSDIGDCFADVKRNVLAGRQVLFSGTPCETAAMLNYLGGRHENLLTVDLVCHGVPSPAVWDAYVREICGAKDYADIKRISFRDKTISWREFSILLAFKDGTEYRCVLKDDPYMQGFLRNLYLRPSCHACRFKGDNRTSDITLADFWGIEKVMPEMYDSRGTSLVLTNTEKGLEFLARIKDKMRIADADVSEALSHNEAALTSVEANLNREEFFNDFVKETSSIRILTERYARRKPLKKRCAKAIRGFMELFKIHTR